MMVPVFTALLLIGIFAAVYCQVQGSSAFSRMVVARTEAEREAEWKHWRQLQYHISLGLVVLICGLTQILK